MDFADQLLVTMTDALIGGLSDEAARCPLDPKANALEFVRHYGPRIDGRNFDFGETGYKHLVEVYEDTHPEQVVMAGAQTGKTGLIQTNFLRFGIVHWASLFGYYFPDQPLAGAFSQERFLPFVKSAPELRPWLGVRPQLDGTSERGTAHVFTRAFGATTFFFLSTKGTSSTESLPLKGVFFDEVRRMSYGDLQRAEERTSAQVDPVNFKVSTAFYPNSDIHAAFLRGDQRYFHTACACPNGVVLALAYPDCVADLKGATPLLRAKVAHAFTHAGRPWLGMTERELAQYGEAAFLCPKCGTVIVDPRDGWWEPHNPGAWAHSYQMPQLLSPTFSAARCFAKANRPNEPVDVQEIWNSMVGLPYIDKEAQPVQPEHLASCVETSLVWPARASDAWRRKNVRHTALGLDAQGGYNVIVIKQLAPNGKFRTIHLEIVAGDDPWEETARLMQRFDVSVAVIDSLPHWNEAHRFAKAFLGRVWLSIYVTDKKSPMVSWKDRAVSDPGQRRAGEEAQFKYMVHIQDVKGLQWSLSRWKRRLNEVPDPRGLVQRLPRQNGRVVLTAGLRVGRMEATPICQDVYFDHLQCVVFRKVYTEEGERRGEYKVVREHVRLDPHFAHANLYADVALSRVGRPARMRLLEEPE